jgi:hypothetical protein
LQEQLIMGIVTHGTLDTLNPTAALGECIDQEHLMHRIAGETIWGGHQDTCKGRHSGPLPEAIEPRPVQCRPAITIITIDVLFGDMPIGVRHTVVPEATQWLVNRLLLVLTARRDTDVESDFQGIPPDDAMAQGFCLRSVP